MAVKYDKSRDRFEVRHYEDLTNKEIVEGVNNIDVNDKKIAQLKSKHKKAQHEVKRLKSEIEDLENYQDVVGRVTHIYNGVPVMQSLSPVTEENPGYGRFTFSGIGSYNKRKSLEAWSNAHLTDEERLTTEHIWCFKMKDGSEKEETFLARQYANSPSENGFTIDFVKTLAYEFVVNDLPITEFYRNLNVWFEKFKRDMAIKDLLDS